MVHEGVGEANSVGRCRRVRRSNLAQYGGIAAYCACRLEIRHDAHFQCMVCQLRRASFCGRLTFRAVGRSRPARAI